MSTVELQPVQYGSRLVNDDNADTVAEQQKSNNNKPDNKPDNNNSDNKPDNKPDNNNRDNKPDNKPDNNKSGNLSAGRRTSESDQLLPERVGALFMLDDNFFRSSFLRHKLPATFLFSNGARGVDPNEALDAGQSPSASSTSPTAPGGGGVVRNVPIRVIGTDSLSSSTSGLTSLNLPRSLGPETIGTLPGGQGRLVPILNSPTVGNFSADGAPARQFSASHRVTFSSDLDDGGAAYYSSRTVPPPLSTVTASTAMVPAGRDSPLTTRAPLVERIPMINYRLVPIVKKYSTPGLLQSQQQLSFEDQQQSQQQPKLQQKNENANNINGYSSGSVARTVAGLTALYGGAASDGTAAARLIRSVNSTPIPAQSMPGGLSSGQPSETVRAGRLNGLRAGVSTPSLLAAAGSGTGTGNGVGATIRRSESPAPKPAVFPSFLRRTQTAHAISPADLPTPSSAGYFSLPSAAAVSAALRHSLHETTVSANSTPAAAMIASGSLTSLMSSRQQDKEKQSKTQQQPQQQQLRFGRSSAELSGGNGKSVTVNGRPVAGNLTAGGTASAKVLLKKASFLPQCIRAQRDASDAEDGDEPLPAPPSLLSTTVRRRDDPVEEAIRSLESFDPNDYTSAASADKNRLKSPTLCAAFSQPVRSPAIVTAGVDQRASTVSFSSVSSTSADAPASSASSPAAGGVSDVTLSSSSEAASPPQPPPAGHWQSSRERTSAPVGQFRIQSAVQAASASSSGSATPTFARSIDSAPLLSAGGGGLRFSVASELRNTMGNNVVQSSGAVVSQAYGTNHSNRDASTSPADYGRAMGPAPPADYDVRRAAIRSANQTEHENGEERLRRYDNFIDRPTQFQHRTSPFHFNSHGYGNVDEPSGGATAAAADAEAHLRKRFLCTQLTDCAKVIEINAHKMQQFTALAGGGPADGGTAWRQPHVLRHNLPALRDTAYTIEFALEELVDALARVLIDPHDQKKDEFRRLSAPLATSLSMLRRLRANLDAVGWALAALARPADDAPHGHDALDQFVIILRQLPKDCYKLVQWVYQLGVWNAQSGAAVFLAASNSSAAGAPPPPAPAGAPLETDFAGGATSRGPFRGQSPAWFQSGSQQFRPQQPKYRNEASRWLSEGPSTVPYGSRSNGNSRSTTPSRHLYEKNNNNGGNDDCWMTTTPTAPFEQQKQRADRNSFSNNKLRTKSPNTVRFSFDNNNDSEDNNNRREQPERQQILAHDQQGRQHMEQQVELQNGQSNRKQQSQQQSQRQQQQQQQPSVVRLQDKDNNCRINNNNHSNNNNGSVDTMDGGESTSSSSEAAEVEELPTDQRKAAASAPSEPIGSYESRQEPIEEPTRCPVSTSTVYEEDDLMSVASDAVDSLYGDYATADSLTKLNSARTVPKNIGFPSYYGSNETMASALRAVSPDEKELLRFHAPQVVAQTAELCRLIEQFFNVVEERQNPKAFVQMIQMICIKAQTLACIARVVARDDACLAAPDRRLHAFLQTAADRLDALLNECAVNARVAREKTESVSAVQAMVSSVVGVSQAALGLRQFWAGSV